MFGGFILGVIEIVETSGCDMLKDTIAAITTPLGESGIAVIRVSGDDSVEIVEKVFSSKTKLSQVPTHTVHYGFIKDQGERIEEVLVTVMRRRALLQKKMLSK